MRRRSNLLVKPLGIFPGQEHASDECAIADDPIGDATCPPVPILCTLTDAHMPDHAPRTIVPRHAYQRSDTIDTLVASTRTPCTEAKLALDSPTVEHPFPERFGLRVAAGYFAYFLCGWGDGVMATVLPHLMEEFNITFMTGSLFYAASTIGFLTGTLILERIHKQLGRVSRTNVLSSWLPFYPSLSKRTGVDACTRFSSLQARHLAVIVSSFLHAMFFAIMGTRGGFPAIFVAHSTAAFARSILTGTLNEFFAIVPKHLSYCFSLWGLGSVVAPLVCQALMAQDVSWYKFYLGTLIGSGLNFIFLALAFRPTHTEFSGEKRNADRELHRSLSLSPTSTIHDGEAMVNKTKAPNTLRLALSQPLQWVICVFSGLYFARWSPSSVRFAVETRILSDSLLADSLLALPLVVWYGAISHQGSSCAESKGRPGSDFRPGCLSSREDTSSSSACVRIANSVPSQFTEFPTSAIALGMQFINWFVPSIPVNGTALAVIGLLFGPVFPASLNWANDMLPHEVRMVSMALISCSASLGCAILPFIAGIILNEKGAHTLPYINVTLTGLLHPDTVAALAHPVSITLAQCCPTPYHLVTMGMTYRQYLSGPRIYGCSGCKTHLATIDSMMSRARISFPAI
ncbi:hypothetical protein NMY22_g38 [Coprinellus aureogranulatus]|nr:hypothetical protein NMY22_g38 [Coprinellus aureogranulatus]